MTRRRTPTAAASAVSIVLVACVALAACGSDSSSGPELPEITLLPTTAPPTTQAAAPATAAPTTTSTTTTTTSTTTTTVAPTTTATGVSALTLFDDGLGVVSFGAEPEGVITFVSSLLGAPTGDTGWVDPFTIGACPGTQLRVVNWGILGLTFGDASNVLVGQPHFFAYAYGIDGQVGGSPSGISSPAGITVGSTVLDLIAAYPGVILNPEDDFLSANFYVNDNLRGYVTGLADDDTVTVVLGGVGCGE